MSVFSAILSHLFVLSSIPDREKEPSLRTVMLASSSTIVLTFKPRFAIFLIDNFDNLTIKKAKVALAIWI